MSSPLHIEELAPTSSRSHYEGIARATLLAMWKQRTLIVLLMVAAFASAMVTLLIVGPRYTAEALLQLHFNRAVSTTGSQPQAIAALDASSLVDSAARVIRSRSTASAVVARLGLDNDPAYARQSNLALLLASLQSWLQMPQLRSTPNDLATNALLGQISVNNDPRSYLISIKVTSRDPARAVELTNAVVLEYLRGELVHALTSEMETAKHNLVEISSLYGERHPSYIRARTVLESLEARLAALGPGSSNEDIVRMVGSPMVLATQMSVAPSGPNFPLVLGLAVAAAAIAGAWIATHLKEAPLRELLRIARNHGPRRR
jgi:uncharacterized protein involved in exopolysaccharide biosynthesis